MNNKTIVNKIKEWLKHDTEDEVCDRITEGRKECAVSLLEQINKWEKDNG